MRLFTLALITLFTMSFAKAQIIITEIMYNPPESGQDFHEFIELHNAGGSDVDMTGYNFLSGVEYTFDAFTLGAGEYVIVAGNSDLMQTDFGVTAFQWTGGSLSNSGELIQLADAGGVIVDEVEYDDGGDWSGLADGTGASLVLCDFTSDNNVGTNWAAANTATGFVAANSGLEAYATPNASVACHGGAFIQFIDNELEVSEDQGTATFRVATSGVSAAMATPTIEILASASSTASIPADVTFMPASATFSLSVAADTMEVTMNIVDDMDIESLETLVLELANPSDGLAIQGVNSQAVLTIADNDAEVADIVINEIMYNTPSVDDYEFIELYNNGETTVNMEGYYFEQGIVKVLPNIDMAPGDYLVIAIDSVLFEDVFGVAAYQWTSGQFGNGGEVIELRDALGNTVDMVEYDDSDPWPTEPDGAGNTLILCDPSSDNSLAESWIAATQSFNVFLGGVEIFGSPGQVNDCSPPVAVDYTPYPIGTVTTVNADGVVDSLGTKAELTGIVHGVDLQANGFLFTIIDDQNDGIAVFNSGDDFGYTVTEGDEVVIQGAVSQFNGLAQIIADTAWMNSAGNALQTPLLVTDLNEDTESQMVQIEPVSILSSVIAGGGLNVTLEGAGGETYLMRADFDTDLTEVFINGLEGMTLSVTGIGGQFDSSVPHTDGYQILPRYQADITVLESVVEPVWASSIRTFPNPVMDRLEVDLSVQADRLVVRNSLGQLVEQLDLNANHFDIITQDWTQGVYYLEIFSKNERAVRKVVKQ